MISSTRIDGGYRARDSRSLRSRRIGEPLARPKCGRRRFALRPGGDRSPRKPRGERSRRWRHRASEREGYACGRRRAPSPVAFFRLAGSRPGGRRPSRDGTASSEPAPSFPGGRGDPAPPATGDRGAVRAGAGRRRHSPRSVPRLARPIPLHRPLWDHPRDGGRGPLRAHRRRRGADDRPAGAPQRGRRARPRGRCATASSASRPTTTRASWSSPGPGERRSARAPT